MVAGMRPALMPGSYVFCAAPSGMDTVPAEALASFREDEGVSLLLPVEFALAEGFEIGPAMRRITLQVLSDLEGIGLTAAVAAALASEDIACNVMAALRHDHVFVPEAQAERALAVLEQLSEGRR
jgi:hypothetical protein